MLGLNLSAAVPLVYDSDENLVAVKKEFWGDLGVVKAKNAKRSQSRERMLRG